MTVPEAMPTEVLERMIAHAQQQRRQWAASLNEHIEGAQRALSSTEHWKQEEIELRLAHAQRQSSDAG